MSKSITATFVFIPFIVLTGCNQGKSTQEKKESAPDFVNWSSYLGDKHGTY
jgi:hypothetical protein